MQKIVSKSQFADALHLSRGRISQLIKAGLPVLKDGKIDMDGAARWYRFHIARPAVSPSFAVRGFW